MKDDLFRSILAFSDIYVHPQFVLLFKSFLSVAKLVHFIYIKSHASKRTNIYVLHQKLTRCLVLLSNGTKFGRTRDIAGTRATCQASVSASLRFSQTFTSVSISWEKNAGNVFYSVKRHLTAKEKGKSLVYCDHHNVNSLCSLAKTVDVSSNKNRALRELFL